MSYQLIIENNGKEIKVKSHSGTIPVGLFILNGHNEGSAYEVVGLVTPWGLNMSSGTYPPAPYNVPPEPIPS